MRSSRNHLRTVTVAAAVALAATLGLTACESQTPTSEKTPVAGSSTPSSVAPPTKKVKFKPATSDDQHSCRIPHIIE